MKKPPIIDRLKKGTAARVTKEVREKRISLRRLLPNVITVLALCAGLTSIRLGLDGQFEYAVGMVFLAAFLDALDGRIARLLKVESKIGAQLDSLVDFLNFGIAPVLLIYIWGIEGMGRLGWLAMLTFSVCAALRLARFNVDNSDPDRPVWMDNFFIGMPSPVAGILVLMPLILTFIGVEGVMENLALVCVYTIIIGMLMVSTIPTFSGKKIGFSLSRRQAMPVLLSFGLLAGTLLTFPWIALLISGGLYLLLMPVGAFVFSRLQKSNSV